MSVFHHLVAGVALLLLHGRLQFAVMSEYADRGSTRNGIWECMVRDGWRTFTALLTPNHFDYRRSSGRLR